MFFIHNSCRLPIGLPSAFGELLLGAGLLKECAGLSVCKEWLGDTFTKEQEKPLLHVKITFPFQAGPTLKWYCRAGKKLEFQLVLCILHARQFLVACLNYWFSYQLTCLDPCLLGKCAKKVTCPTRQSTHPRWWDGTFFRALIPSNLLILHSLRDYWSIKNDASWKISAFSQDLNFKNESLWILGLLQIDPSQSLEFWYGISESQKLYRISSYMFREVSSTSKKNRCQFYFSLLGSDN